MIGGPEDLYLYDIVPPVIALAGLTTEFGEYRLEDGVRFADGDVLAASQQQLPKLWQIGAIKVSPVEVLVVLEHHQPLA